MQKLFMAIGLLLATAVASPAQVTTIFGPARLQRNPSSMHKGWNWA